MRRTLPAFVFALIPAAPLFADLVGTVDLLDPSDGGPLPPSGVLVLDFLVEVDAGDAWLASALAATAVAGNSILYDDGDPNSPLLNPGAADPFVTCVSVPLARFGTARFNACRATIIGSDCPHANHPISDPSHVSATWHDEVLISCANRPTESGAIARVAVALDPELACNGDVGCCFAVYPGSDVPDGAVPVLEGNCSAGPPNPPFGIAWATCDNPNVVWVPWILAQTPVAGSCRYDLNRDRTIDVEDLAVVLGAFGAVDGQPGFNPLVDFDANGRIDLQDLATFLAHYGAF